MNPKLTKIRDEFCKGLDPKSFKLTNMSLNSPKLPKFVNSLLLATLLASPLAHSSIADDFETNDFYRTSFENLQRDGFPSEKEQISTKYKAHAKHLSNHDIIQIANGELSGAFKLPSSDQIVFIYNQGIIELDHYGDEMILDRVISEEFPVFHKANFSVASKDGDGFNVIKVGYNDYTKSDVDFQKKYPYFSKHEDLITTLHELAHAERMLDPVTDGIEIRSLGPFEAKLVNEAFASVYSLIALPAIHKSMKNGEAIQIMKEHSNQRREHSNQMDSTHGVSFAIDNLVNVVKNNPNLIQHFKVMSHYELLGFAESIAKESTLDLASRTVESDSTFLPNGQKDEIPTVLKDVEYFMANGHHGEDYVMKHIRSTSASERYDIAVRALAEHMESNGGDWTDARRTSVTETGSRAYYEAYMAFRNLDILHSLNDTLNQYEVNVKNSYLMVEKALVQSGYIRNIAHNNNSYSM